MSAMTQGSLVSPRAALRASGLRAARDVFRRAPWSTGYRRRLMLTDAAVIVAAIALTDVVRGEAATLPAEAWRVALSLGLAVLWMAALLGSRSYDPRVFGSGPMEYHRVFDASWRLFSVVTVVAFLVAADAARTYLLVTLPVGLAGLLTFRYAWRQWLHRHRAERGMTTAVLAVGLREQAERLIQELNETRPDFGYRVVGVCIPTGTVRAGEEVAGVPVLGDLRTAGTVAQQIGADCVAVSSSDAITADVVRKLGWQLEPVGVDLMLTAELAGVAGPRITITPASGVALLHVDAPRFEGPKFLLKAAVDWVGAAVLTLVLAPVLAAIALAVKVTSPGPALFRQERVGLGGRRFNMLKFRTMDVDAEARAAALKQQANDGAGPLFKQRHDPRITRIGRVLRRYSLDELPQLFNVLGGSMSLVGPRPPLPAEASAYEARMRRRFLVKPGLTGLWQVGGRSDLEWEECVRLDVYYAENWTLFGDLMILARTARAVLTGAGAY